MKRFVAVVAVMFLVTCLSLGQGNFGPAPVGIFPATWYAYGDQSSVPPLKVAPGGGTNATGTGTLTLSLGRIALANGRNIMPLAVGAPVFVDSGSNQETVTPTAVSCSTPDVPNTCTFTASFLNVHGAGAAVASASFGLQEAIDDAYAQGGGTVGVDGSWTQLGGVNATLTAALPYPNVQIEDRRQPLQYWNAGPTITTAFSAPSALTSATVASSTTVAGSASYAAGTIHVCYALVDLMGNEGPCSADYSFTDTSAKAIVFNAPPAATGAIGWVPYIGLEAGSSAQEYQMPLASQPTAVNVAPASNGVCTLSAILLAQGHYACAITNATYGQTGSAATITAYPVVTSPHPVFTGGLSTASYYVGNSNSHTVYSYTPGANPGTPGIVKASLPFGITTAAASTVPQVLGTLKLPAGFMNYVGRTIEVCGYAYSSTQGASSVVQIAFEWDAQGSDVTTGLPVIIGGPSVTNTLTTGTTGQFDFCQQFTTTVAAATATGGTILAGHGYLVECALTTCATPAAGPNMTVAAVGSLNLALESRLHVIMVQTTSSTAVPKLISLTVKVLN